jgi:hypothetical protein
MGSVFERINGKGGLQQHHHHLIKIIKSHMIFFHICDHDYKPMLPETIITFSDPDSHEGSQQATFSRKVDR